MSAGDWAGRPLGERTASWTERDAILYALAVGAPTDDLDLVLETRLRVLPTFGLTLAQWAPDELAEVGAWDPTTAVHGAQRLDVRAALPPAGQLTMTAAVEAVWDKGSAAVFDVRVESACFVATWSVFAPGYGGFGGDRGPAAPAPATGPAEQVAVAIRPEQAALYRLLGDRHAMHVDPEAGRAAGQPRPFLHGLCTLAAATLPLARLTGAHPADLRSLEGRFAGPVFPGEVLAVAARVDGRAVTFDAAAGDRRVLTAGRVAFDPARREETT